MLLRALLVLLTAAATDGLSAQPQRQAPKKAAARRQRPRGSLFGRHAEDVSEPADAPSTSLPQSGARLEVSTAIDARMAVIMAGTADRVLVKPLISNVIGANAKPNVAIDFFLSLRAPTMNVAKEYAADKNETKWLKSESTDRYTMDPEVRRFYEQNSERQDDLNHVKATELLMIDICDFARKSGASHCHWKLEGEEALVMPEDQAHHNVMMYYNPLETAAGKAVLYKWRSTGVLWDKAKAREEQFGEYSVVVVARDDDYWIGPYYINAVDFLDNPSLTRVIPCLESHGINDKAVIMGRKSADALLTTYTDWKGELGDELLGTRNAEEFWFKKALASGLTLVPSAMPMAVASFTSSGIPCFRKQNFNLSAHGGYEQCYGESNKHKPLTKFFHEFNCDELKPAYFDALPRRKVMELHGALAKLGEKSKSIVLTLINATQADLAVNMLSSLAASGEKAPCLVVGTQPGTCSALKILQGRGHSDHICVEVPHVQPAENLSVPFTELEIQTFKHAIMTTVIVSGLSQGVLYAAADTVFVQAPMQFFKRDYPGSHMVVTANNVMKENPETCTDVADKYEKAEAGQLRDRLRIYRRSLTGEEDSARFDINSGLIFAQNSPGTADVMLRSWMLLVTRGSAENTQHWALQQAIQDASWVNVQTGSCTQFVNGNVFWGHCELLKMSDVISVHANWMTSTMKVPCLKEAGLWMDKSAPRRLTFNPPTPGRPLGRLDSKGATVEICGADVAPTKPTEPTEPGCYVWLPSGCPDHNYNATSIWRRREDANVRSRCLIDVKEMLDAWCGTTGTQVLFIAPPPSLPPQPQTPGCYIYIPSGCEKHMFKTRTWRMLSSTDYPNRDTCQEKAAVRHDRWCDVDDSVALWVPAPLPSP